MKLSAKLTNSIYDEKEVLFSIWQFILIKTVIQVVSLVFAQKLEIFTTFIIRLNLEPPHTWSLLSLNLNMT